MERLGVSHGRASRLRQKRVAAQWLVSSSTACMPCHSPGPLRPMTNCCGLQGVREDSSWRRDFTPFFALPPSVQRLAQHAFTESLNNAVHHSGGMAVTLSLR